MLTAILVCVILVAMLYLRIPRRVCAFFSLCRKVRKRCRKGKPAERKLYSDTLEKEFWVAVSARKGARWEIFRTIFLVPIILVMVWVCLNNFFFHRAGFLIRYFGLIALVVMFAIEVTNLDFCGTLLRQADQEAFKAVWKKREADAAAAAKPVKPAKLNK